MRSMMTTTTDEQVKTHGTVKTIIEQKGFGFITPDNHGGDVFFHISEVPSSIPFDATLQGKRLQFLVESTDKGTRAYAVEAID